MQLVIKVMMFILISFNNNLSDKFSSLEKGWPVDVLLKHC